MDFVLVVFVSQIVVFYSLIVGFEFLRHRDLVTLKGIAVSSSRALAKAEQIWRKAS